jgi:Holliday junction resolvase RusA-like endonuclease
LIFEQTFTWKPKVKDRPRVTKFGTFTPKATLDAERAIAEQYEGPKFEGPIAVEFDFWNDRIFMRIIEVSDFTQRRLTGDVDNYLKLVGDGLNKIAYEDDKQIVDLRGRKN